MLIVQNFDEAQEYYDSRVQHYPDEPDGWYGLAAVRLARGDVDLAASLLVKAHEIDPLFPVGQLVRQARPDGAEVWYELARRLVSMRRRSSYKCADEVLGECGRSTGASERLRERAQHVRKQVLEALEHRLLRDSMREGESGRAGAGTALLRWIAGLCIVVGLATGAWIANSLLSSAPPPLAATSESTVMAARYPSSQLSSTNAVGSPETTAPAPSQVVTAATPAPQTTPASTPAVVTQGSETQVATQVVLPSSPHEDSGP